MASVSMRPQTLRHVRGGITLVDDTYPDSGYEYIRIAIQGDQPVLDVNNGSTDKLRFRCNVGVGTIDAGEVLSISSTTGNLSTSGAVIAQGGLGGKYATGTDGVIAAGTTFYKNTGTPAAGFTISGTPVDGSLLLIKNAAAAAVAFEATSIAAGATAHFVYASGAWVAL
jgi:hypothetical protein